MSDYRDFIRVVIDPEHSEPLPSGGRVQDLSIVMSDLPDRLTWAPPSIRVITPGEARELAFELLSAAEHAERMRSVR